MNSTAKTFVVMLFLAISAVVLAGPNPPVTVVGKMREVMQGDSKPRIRLEDLDLDHLYGVGPITGMAGEMTIIDGRVSLARVLADGSISVDHAPSCSTPLLV